MSGRTARINRGRGHSYLLDGQPVIGVTTAISKGAPKPTLPGWAAREVAGFALDNLNTITTLDRDASFDLLTGAPWRERDKAARRGTEVHTLAERLGNGEEVEVPDELAGHVDAYLEWLERWNPAVNLAEAVVINRRWRYMGTLDLVANIDGLGKCLIDLKTTRSGVFPETAFQLAAYRHAETWLHGGVERPMPQVDWTGVLWVRADGADLVPVAAGPDEFRQFLYVKQTAEWFTDRADRVIGPTVPPPTPPQLEVVR